MFITKKHISRRTVLRGAGAALALPFLEAMVPAATATAQTAAAAKPHSNRRIIDISGDGTNNSGRPVTEARDQAVSEGVTINGLAIVNDRPNPGYAFHTQPPGGLPEWYRQNVIGGPGSFLRVIDDFRSFSDAMTNKLVSEIVALAGEEQTASVR